MMANVTAVFEDYAASIEIESQVREAITLVVKKLEKSYRAAATALEGIHHSQGLQNLPGLCEACRKEISEVPDQFKELEGTLPVAEFYKYHVHFKLTTQKLVYLLAMMCYLQENRLTSFSEVCGHLGLKMKREEGLHLDLEDYLQGVLHMGSELARLSVNAVSAGDYMKPFQINHFLRELQTGFSLLHPKHELRKRFDELKYSVKKTEEVVYNLSLRGMKPQDDVGTSG